MKTEVTLTGEQALLCQAVLCQEVMKVSGLLASGKDARGRRLTNRSRRELVGFSSRLQLTLMTFGLAPGYVENLVRHVSSMEIFTNARTLTLKKYRPGTPRATGPVKPHFLPQCTVILTNP